MKLNYKRVIFVGLAFFLISSFWIAFDAIIPLILQRKYGMNQTQSGFIMSLDNILSLFLLPLFGTISDKTKTKFGKRTPYIFGGTICAVIAFISLSFTNNLVLFIVILLFVLLSMATFRSPAVALMPDVTIKPLRSKGNAIINLVGTVGGILTLVLGIVFKTSAEGKTDFTAYIIAVGGLMLVALIIFLLTVKEPKWVKEMEEDTKRFNIEEDDESNNQQIVKLSKEKTVSLFLILGSVFLWYMGYNAVTTKGSMYASDFLGKDFNLMFIIAQATAVIAFVPAGILASKIGRRKSILCGITLLALAFFLAFFVRNNTKDFVLYILFALAGVGWATINVNSFPMVVELASGGDVGKFTGYYYTASMAAQTITPVLSGFIMDLWGTMLPLFLYATIFVALSFVTMFLVKHGDSKIKNNKSFIENFDVDN